MNDQILPKRFVQPDVVVSHFHINPGDTVVDIGAGNGYFLATLVEAVGDNGVVYACEIQKNLVDSLGAQAQKYTGGVVKPVWGDVESIGGTKIPDQSADRVIMVNTLFMFEDKKTALEEISRILGDGGKVFVIDWTDPSGGLGPPPSMIIDEKTAIETFEANGFVLENTYPAGDHHYGLSFRLV